MYVFSFFSCLSIIFSFSFKKKYFHNFSNFFVFYLFLHSYICFPFVFFSTMIILIFIFSPSIQFFFSILKFSLTRQIQIIVRQFFLNPGHHSANSWMDLRQVITIAFAGGRPGEIVLYLTGTPMHRGHQNIVPVALHNYWAPGVSMAGVTFLHFKSLD